jgi:hypothetical protein
MNNNDRAGGDQVGLGWMDSLCICRYHENWARLMIGIGSVLYIAGCSIKGGRK